MSASEIIAEGSKFRAVLPRPFYIHRREQPAKAFVLDRYDLARINRSGDRFRVFLGWRNEPCFPWRSNRRKAWDDAANFLRAYPNSPYVSPRDAKRVN